MAEEKQKPKKPIHKRWWFWLVLLILFSFIVSDDEEQIDGVEEQKEQAEQEEQKKKEEQEEKKKAEKEAKEKEEAEKKEKEEKEEAEKKEKEEKERKEKEEAKEKEKEEERKQKEEAEKKEKEEKKSKENKSTAETLEESDSVDVASMNGSELTLKYNPGTVWSENSFMTTVYDMFEDVKTAFEDEKIDSVAVEIETTMTDEKGNESVDPIIKYNYSREAFEELNYENFSSMAFSEEWRILREADYYYIHPGIYKNLKDKYTDNLNVEGFGG